MRIATLYYSCLICKKGSELPSKPEVTGSNPVGCANDNSYFGNGSHYLLWFQINYIV